ncbi:MAG: LTA synthase family protein, partial [Proteobacteria bacterium]|nr:LTA synthase family protein [Pseudomonadota bacterium]
MHSVTLFIAVLFAPVLIRLALLSHKGVAPSFVDVRGFTSDILVSFIIALILVFIFRLKPLAGIVILLLWSLLSYGVYEHVMALGALPSLSNIKYLGDATFLKASVLSVSRPLLFLPVVLFPPTLGAVLFWGGRTRLRPVAFIYPAIFFLIINIFWKDDSEALMWRQANFAHDNVGLLVSFGGGAEALGSTDRVSLSGAELNGEPVIELPGSAKNVLLIMLESVSGAYIDSAADYHNIESPITMPLLSALAKENIHYPTFVANQRQTNRGEYAILCGEYPKLASEVAKMSEVAFFGGEKPCLPAVLGSAGFETVYLQSAPLAFMLKEQFMERVGFSKVYGDDYFKQAYKRNAWGVDDRAYFEQSVDLVAKLSAGEKPWFLTMLTVGSHDPYNVPDDYNSPYEEGSIGEAFSYLDSALSEFLSTLEAKGLLKDTLILLTSDESAGITHKTSDLLTKLSQNWGFFIAITPGGEQMEIDGSFMQVDIALSILDYLGLGEVKNDFSGRSLFRAYEKERPIFFGNTYMHLVGAIDTSGSPGT